MDYEQDGTRWLHIELAAKQKDNYSSQDAVPDEYYNGVCTGLSEDEATRKDDGNAESGDDNASGNLMSCATTFTAKDLSGSKRMAAAEATKSDGSKKKKRNSLDRECKSLGVASTGVSTRSRASVLNDDLTL